MDLFDSFQRLALALAIGMVIGIERGWQARDYAEGQRTAGVRTFALSGLLGGVLAAVSLPDRFIVLASGFLVHGAVLAAFSWREIAARQNFSATTVIAGLVTFALGALAMVGDMRLAAAAGVATAALLAIKAALHGWLRQLAWVELRAALILLAMTFVMLPLLPDRTVDPWNALNPHSVWVMTIAIASISFAGYIAVRALGERQGIMIAGIAGGLVASTAVTLTFARLAAANPAGARLLGGGAVAAGGVMMLRALGVASVVSPVLFPALAPALLPAAGVTMLAAWVLARQTVPGEAPRPALSLDNPFELATVLKFGALLAALFVLSRWVEMSLGDQGLFVLSAVSGLADVDAITLSMARLSGQGTAVTTATIAILIVVASNTACKIALGWSVGGTRIGLPLAFAGAAAVAAGAVGLLVGGDRGWTALTQ
jgi:uncharacterized membrane protein (DUF4010 family)